MSLSTALTEFVLPLPETVLQQAWQQSQAAYSPENQWRRYLHHLCLATLLPWIQAEEVPGAIAFPAIADRTTLAEFLPGAAIALGDKRLILIPSLSLDQRDWRVPQEWVDLPGWAGDYFAAVRVDLDEGELQVLGYATHEMVKTKGIYDGGDRTYQLDMLTLIPDLNSLWVVQQLNPTEVTQVAIDPLPSLSPAQATDWLQQLRSVPDPRLAAPFGVWGCLLVQDDWRQQLYDLRQTAQARSAESQSPVQLALTQLQQWFHEQWSSDWQSVNAFALEAIALRDEGSGDKANLPTAKRVKVLRFAELAVLMLLQISLEPDRRLMIRIQLRPLDRTQCLPSNLVLQLLSDQGEVLQQVETRDRDDAIQLRRFRCPIGTHFQVQVQLADEHLTEDFVA
jgi:Protein of unknown function (DUF1822)